MMTVTMVAHVCENKGSLLTEDLYEIIIVSYHHILIFKLNLLEKMRTQASSFI